MSQVFLCDLHSSPFAHVKSVVDNLLSSSHNWGSVANNQAIVTSFEDHHPSSSSRDSAVIQDARCRAACNMRLHHAHCNLATADAGFRTSAAASVGSFVPFPRLLRAHLLILLLNRNFLAAGSYMCYALGLDNDISRRPIFGPRQHMQQGCSSYSFCLLLLLRTRANGATEAHGMACFSPPCRSRGLASSCQSSSSISNRRFSFQDCQQQWRNHIIFQ